MCLPKEKKSLYDIQQIWCKAAAAAKNESKFVVIRFQQIFMSQKIGFAMPERKADEGWMKEQQGQLLDTSWPLRCQLLLQDNKRPIKCLAKRTYWAIAIVSHGVDPCAPCTLIDSPIARLGTGQFNVPSIFAAFSSDFYQAKDARKL